MTVRGPLVSLTTLVLLLVGLASDARAQHDDPVGPFVIDAHVALPNFSNADAIASAFSLRTDQLPQHGLGFELGVHVYPLRRKVTLGLGATLMRARGRKAPSADSETAATDPTIETRVTTLMPQLSLNFGTTRGWSYISAGFGRTRRATGDAATTLPTGTNAATLSYGGGARWFLATHVAFSFDLRFYRLRATEATDDQPGLPRHSMFVSTVGLSFK
jgi:hypothetical protein